MLRTRKSLSIVALLLGSLLATGCLSGDEQITPTELSVTGRPYFDLFKSDSGRYYFNLKAANHEIILASQSYSSRTGALGGVLSVLDNGGELSSYDVREAKDGSYYFNLKAANGKTIGTSEMYSTKSNAKAGANSVLNAIGDYLTFVATRTGARFQVSEGQDGRYYFTLHAGNGAVVLQSQGYNTEASALNGTFSVALNGIDADNYDVREASNGGYYFNVIASNGQVVGTSEVYDNKSNAVRARNSIIELLPHVDLL